MIIEPHKTTLNSFALNPRIAHLQLGRSAGRASRQDLDDFLQTYDLEEAIGVFIGKTGGVDMDMNKVTMIDVSQFQAQAAETIKPVYRDYPDD